MAIRPGLQVEVPPRAAFGGTVAVYGTPYSDATPTEADLGCRIISSDGHSGALSHAGLESLDRLVIDGTAVLPLLKVTGGTGTASLECDGPASTRSQPMYLLSLPGAGELAPMAAYSVGTLTLVIGLAGMATLRPADH